MLMAILMIQPNEKSFYTRNVKHCIPFVMRKANGTNTSHDMRVIKIVEVSDIILMAYLAAI